MSVFLAVRFLAVVLLLVAAGKAHGADWRDTVSRRPGKFQPLRPLTAHYDFGWSGLKAAEATAEFSRDKGGRVQLKIDGQTVGAARALWRMDASATSTAHSSTMRPIKLQQRETYSRKSMITTVDYTAAGAASVRQPHPPDAKPAKVKRFKFAEVHDLHSALLFIRSQPLRAGQTTRLCIYPGSSPYLAEITVTGREKLKTAGKEWSAIRCDLKLRSVARDFTLGEHKKFKRATAWISDDADRLLLRLEAEIFIGKVYVELDEVKFGAK